MNPKNNDIMVYKANKLIEARYNLDLNEQKLILYAASKIDSLSDEKFPRIELSLSDFFNLIGNKESKNHDYMKDVAKGLMAKQLEIQLPNGGWELVQWVIKSTYEPNKGIVSFQFHSDLVPYLLKLGKHYKGYPLQQVMQLNSKYSIRLYELLIQWEYSNHKSLTIETNELKKKMGIQEGAYERFGNFENYVIKTAVSELNNQSNIFVTYEKIKVGRSIKQIKFRFEVKNNQNSKSIEEFRKLIDAGLANHIREIKEMFNDDKLAFSDVELDRAYTLSFNKLSSIKSIGDNLQEAIYRYMLYYYEYTKDKANRNAYNYFEDCLKNDYDNLQVILKYTNNISIIIYGELLK